MYQLYFYDNAELNNLFYKNDNQLAHLQYTIETTECI